MQAIKKNLIVLVFTFEFFLQLDEKFERFLGLLSWVDLVEELLWRIRHIIQLA